MTHTIRARHRRGPWPLALVCALALSLTGIGFAPGAHAADGPTIALSQASGFDPDSPTTITVTGTGFTETALGTRPPLAGQPGGIYVVFGRTAEVWRPSDSAPSSSRTSLSQRWAMPEASASVPALSSNPDVVVIDPDGSFTTTLTVAPGGESGTYAVYTFAGSGAVNADHELWQEITFATAGDDGEDGDAGGGDDGSTEGPEIVRERRDGVGPLGQRLSVDPATGLDPDGDTVVVSGAGFDPALGIYVGLCVDNGPGLRPGPCVGGVDMDGGGGSSAWITDDPTYAGIASPFVGGGFEVVLSVRAADEFVDCMDGATRCVIATRADHTAGHDRSADVLVPVSFVGEAPLVDAPPASPAPAPSPEAPVVTTPPGAVAGAATLPATGAGAVTMTVAALAVVAVGAGLCSMAGRTRREEVRR